MTRLAAADVAAASDAAHALQWLLADDGLESLSQYGVQQFCWYELPFKWVVEPNVRNEIVAALARFFDLAGLARYAALCRSATTARVLLAWTESPSRGYAAFRAAATRSGVDPCDIEEFRWGAMMGVGEFEAFWSCAMALELAVEVGELKPGAKGWHARQQAIVRGHLLQPRDELLGENYLQALVTERLSSWVEGSLRTAGQSMARAQLLRPIVNALLHEIRAPRAVGRALMPLQWLIDTIAEAEDSGGAIVLTQNHNLPRSLVVEAAETFPRWWPLDFDEFAPRQESDIGELVALHDLLRASKLARRVGRRLVLTERGRSARADAKVLWRVVAEWLGSGAGFDAAVAELVMAALLSEPLIDRRELAAEVLVAVTEQGWQRGATGEPVSSALLEDALMQVLVPMRTLGLVREKGPVGGRLLRLTDAGRATALAALRSRALTPTDRL